MDRPPTGWTATVLSGGTLLSAGCFMVGFGLRVLGRDVQTEDPRRLELVLQTVLELDPWGWSMLGVLVLLATPAVGLVASFLEMRRLQPRSASLALVVLAILTVATAVAVTR
ncbi:MAG: DUF1634 domain-containing protein [Chloroflexota bacterium]|nr:DUF1634 domain-containing protein [Chloroflexota bacterium]